MTVEVLLSCMHRNSVEEVMELVNRTNIKGACVVVSQCDREEIVQHGQVKIIFTKERGLSRSRNMAIRNATGDICLICDDDEVLDDNYMEMIKAEYSFDKSDFICFYIQRIAQSCPTKKIKLNFKNFWRIASVEISFKRESIQANAIIFDERLGSGVSNCGGEENKFLLECLKHRLKGFYVPTTIGRLIPDSPSQWFKGYDENYFKDKKKFDRIVMGACFGRMLSIYFLIRHRKLIKKSNPNINMFKIASLLLK